MFFSKEFLATAAAAALGVFIVAVVAEPLVAKIGSVLKGIDYTA